ncbi:MAG: B12-binding domain-containing radical SAM protein [Victivallales bacterium]|nr:B12-binding domain-containing radical SAM protein [Victivallales bacterium]
MKILLIMPDAHMHKIRIGRFVRSMREMPLSICTLAAMISDIPGINIKLIDGSVEDIPLDYPADLVGISVITGCALSAYQIADHYRKNGTPVVLGGVHVTILPGEAINHADAIMIGRGEHSWPELVRDFMRGIMRKVYREQPIDGDELLDVPLPRHDLHRKHGYMIPYAVHATRGCRRNCDFCTVPAVWPKYLKRPIADVVRDIRKVPGRYIALNDVSLAEDPEYAKELFKAMIPLKKRWGGLATVDIIRDQELLSLMSQSGCSFLLFGFESNEEAVLKQIHKGFNKPVNYHEVMETMHSLGISVQGCFVFGFDDDDHDIFNKTVERVRELKIDIPRYSIYTPYPGTGLFRRLLAEKRIISFNWNDYDTMHVVIQPAKMTPDELFSGFKQAYKDTFKLQHILGRMRGFGINSAINFCGNLAYRIFVKRLNTEPRFDTPYSRDCPGVAPPAEYYNTNFKEEQTCQN